MGAARDESQALQHMEHVFRRFGRIEFGGRKSWTQHKVAALEAVRRELGGTVDSILDLGPGSLCPLQAWPYFTDPERPPLRYTGVEGSAYIVEQQRQRFPQLEFVHRKLSEWLEVGPDPADYTVALAMDVLYHVPEDHVHDSVLRDLFAAGRAVVLTYSPVVQDFGGRSVGEGGFAWFPRPSVEEFLTEKAGQGWRAVYCADFSGGPQKQRLVALVWR